MYILIAGAEWDERKRLSNLIKHGIDFIRASKVFEGRILTVERRQHGSGEERFSVLGKTENVVLYVVYTRRGDNLRIISARRAGRHERERYYESLV
jgi:uncharacterized protein